MSHRLISHSGVRLPTLILGVMLPGCAPAGSLPDTNGQPLRPVIAADRAADEGGALVPTAEQVASLRAHPGYATEPFVVTNLLAFSDAPSRQRYFGEYAPQVLELILRHGGEVVWAGAVDDAFAESGGDSWDDIVLVRWPSRRTFIEAFGSPEYAPLDSVRQSSLVRTVMFLTDAQDRRTAESATDSAQAAAAITAVWEAWMEAYERGDAAALAELFTEDGIYAANTGQLLRGREGIRDGVQGWIERRPAMLESFGLAADAQQNIVIDVLRFRTAGDAAHGLLRFDIQVEPSRCLVDSGHLLTVWRRQGGGEWRIESLVVNQLREPPENACALR